MPPTLVRPQTFDSLKSPDSASPAVRRTSHGSEVSSEPVSSSIRTKYLFNLRLSGVYEPIALSAYPSLPTFLRRRDRPRTLMLGFLSPLSGWVNDQKYITTIQLQI